jgi:DNA-binding FadR family transcriptional regulator
MPDRPSEIAAQIESEILKAGASSGSHVALRKDLLERFNTSPSVINEALRILRERGLVTVKPGPYGGIFVADDIQWVKLGGINMWFRQSPFSPLELFRSRVHLEDVFARAAVERITPEDARTLAWTLEDLRSSTSTALDYWAANLRLHTAIARASKLNFLCDMYQALIICLSQSLMHAEFVEGHESMLEHNLGVHGELVRAIQARDVGALEKALANHREDMVRASDATWSPDVAARATRKRLASVR